MEISQLALGLAIVFPISLYVGRIRGLAANPCDNTRIAPESDGC